MFIFTFLSESGYTENFKIQFLKTVLTALGLCCLAGAFSSCRAWTSLDRLQVGGLQSMGPPLLHVDSSGPGVEPVYLAVAGGFCSTAPLRKSPNSCSLICLVVMRPTHQVCLVKTVSLLMQTSLCISCMNLESHLSLIMWIELWPFP